MMGNIVTEKKCTVCNLLKKIDQFYRRDTTKDGLRPECKECSKNTATKWQQKTRKKPILGELLRIKDKLAYWNNEKIRNRKIHNSNKRYSEKKDEISKKCKDRLRTDEEYRNKKHASDSKYSKQRYMKNESFRTKIKEYGKLWRKNNPEKAKASQIRYKTRKLENGGSFTGEQYKELIKHYSPNGECLACRDVRKLTADHVRPLFLGGDNNIGNIQPLCLSCNDKKGIKEIDYRYDNGSFARRLEKNE